MENAKGKNKKRKLNQLSEFMSESDDDTRELNPSGRVSGTCPPSNDEFRITCPMDIMLIICSFFNIRDRLFIFNRICKYTAEISKMPSSWPDTIGISYDPGLRHLATYQNDFFRNLNPDDADDMDDKKNVNFFQFGRDGNCEIFDKISQTEVTYHMARLIHNVSPKVLIYKQLSIYLMGNTQGYGENTQGNVVNPYPLFYALKYHNLVHLNLDNINSLPHALLDAFAKNNLNKIQLESLEMNIVADNHIKMIDILHFLQPTLTYLDISLRSHLNHRLFGYSDKRHKKYLEIERKMQLEEKISLPCLSTLCLYEKGHHDNATSKLLYFLDLNSFKSSLKSLSLYSCPFIGFDTEKTDTSNTNRVRMTDDRFRLTVDQVDHVIHEVLYPDSINANTSLNSRGKDDENEKKSNTTNYTFSNLERLDFENFGANIKSRERHLGDYDIETSPPTVDDEKHGHYELLIRNPSVKCLSINNIDSRVDSHKLFNTIGQLINIEFLILTCVNCTYLPFSAMASLKALDMRDMAFVEKKETKETKRKVNINLPSSITKIDFHLGTFTRMTGNWFRHFLDAMVASCGQLTTLTIYYNLDCEHLEYYIQDEYANEITSLCKLTSLTELNIVVPCLELFSRQYLRQFKNLTRLKRLKITQLSRTGIKLSETSSVNFSELGYCACFDHLQKSLEEWENEFGSLEEYKDKYGIIKLAPSVTFSSQFHPVRSIACLIRETSRET